MSRDNNRDSESYSNSDGEFKEELTGEGRCGDDLQQVQQCPGDQLSSKVGEQRMKSSVPVISQSIIFLQYVLFAALLGVLAIPTSAWALWLRPEEDPSLELGTPSGRSPGASALRGTAILEQKAGLEELKEELREESDGEQISTNLEEPLLLPATLPRRHSAPLERIVDAWIGGRVDSSTKRTATAALRALELTDGSSMLQGDPGLVEVQEMVRALFIGPSASEEVRRKLEELGLTPIFTPEGVLNPSIPPFLSSYVAYVSAEYPNWQVKELVRDLLRNEQTRATLQRGETVRKVQGPEETVILRISTELPALEQRLLLQAGLSLLTLLPAGIRSEPLVGKGFDEIQQELARKKPKAGEVVFFHTGLEESLNDMEVMLLSNEFPGVRFVRISPGALGEISEPNQLITLLQILFEAETQIIPIQAVTMVDLEEEGLGTFLVIHT